MVRPKLTQSWLRKVLKKKKTNTVKHCVEAVVETTMQMNSGLGVTFASDGTMGNV